MTWTGLKVFDFRYLKCIKPWYCRFQVNASTECCCLHFVWFVWQLGSQGRRGSVPSAWASQSSTQSWLQCWTPVLSSDHCRKELEWKIEQCAVTDATLYYLISRKKRSILSAHTHYTSNIKLWYRYDDKNLATKENSGILSNRLTNICHV